MQVFSLLIFSLFASNIKVSAQIPQFQPPQTIDCGKGYTSNISLAPGSYDFFIEPNALATSFIKLSMLNVGKGTCQQLANVTNTSEPQLIGTFEANPEGLSGVLILENEAKVDFASPDSPKVFIRPKDSTCDPTKKCTVTYEGGQFELLPNRLSLSTDSLSIYKFQSLEDDEVKRVIYSLDGNPIYKSDRIEPFNAAYIPPGSHEAQRTVVMQSGQTLTDTTTIERSFAPQHLISSTYYQNKNFIQLIIIAVGLFVTTYSLLLLSRRIHQKIIWRKTHVASVQRSTTSTQEVLHKEMRSATIRPFKRALILATIIGICALICTNWFVSIFSVDGVSMYPTLQNGQRVMLNKLPATWAKINGREFIPSRGEIIVFKHNELNQFNSNIAGYEEYLVKRVLALPGERVVMQGDKITVYNDESTQGFDPDLGMSWQQSTQPNIERSLDIVLGAGELFVVGDNRVDSIDSRYYGPINVSDIVGKAR